MDVAHPSLGPTARPLSQQVVEESRAVLAAHARTFQLASRLLPPANRDAAAVLYALCRLIDDIADDADDGVPPGVVRSALRCLRAELTGSQPPRPLVAAWLEVAARTGAPLQPLLDLIEGVLSDVGPVRLPDDDALLVYCYRVAGTVGLLMSPLLGVTHPEAAAPARDLGIAMQLTNICRDVAEDLGRDRVYLPERRLQAAGASQELLLGGRGRAAVAVVVAELLELAEAHYDRGLAGTRHIPLRSRLAIRVAAVVYRAIGRRLLRVHAGDALHGRTIVPVASRAALVLGQLLLFPFLVLRDVGRPSRSPPAAS